MKNKILSEQLDPAALLNKKLADVAKSNPSGDMWFIKAPTWEGCSLADEENDGNFSYWHLYNQDDEHKGTISVENGVITHLPRNLSESKKMKKQILSEELKRMNKLAGLMNENIDEARWQNDPWADIETGGEYSKYRDRVNASYKRQKEEDSLGSTSYQSFTNKIKGLGNLMTDEEAIEMMDDMKRMLSQDEIMDVYNFVDRNNISSPIYTYLDQYKGETGSYGLEENGGFDIEKTKHPVDLSSVDPHTLEQIKKQLLARNGEMPTDEELRNVVSVMNLEEAQDSEDVMIKEGQLGKAITKMLIESIFGFERGPSGTNRGEIGHKDYEKDMAKWNAELKAAEERREQAKKNYETPSYNTNTGGGWTPETLIDFVKKRYNVEVPEEYKESDPEKPWMAIKKIKDYLANLAKG